MSDLDEKLKDVEARLRDTESRVATLRSQLAQQKTFTEHVFGNVIDLFGVSIQYIEALPNNAQHERIIKSLEELQKSIKDTFATERGVNG